MRAPTWLLEQAVFVAVLAPSTWLATTADATPRGVARALLGALCALAAQKARSGADRRREQDELAGARPARLACDRAISRWAAVAQILAVAGVFLGARDLVSYAAALLPVLYVLAYPSWRRWYRRRRPATPELAQAEARSGQVTGQK